MDSTPIDNSPETTDHGRRADSIRVVHPLFHAGGGGSIPTSALQLTFAKANLETAKRLNTLWHSVLPMYGKRPCRIAYTAEAYSDGLYYASAIWTNPLARLLPQLEWIELNRLAIAPDAPKNTATRMLAWMAKDIRKRFPEVTRLISYQDIEAHAGTIYQAAGWTQTRISDTPRWKDHPRPSFSIVRAGPKQRWEKIIR